MLKKWFKSGDPWVWLNAGAVSISLVLVFGLLVLIAVRGLGHFWPHAVHQISVVQDGQSKILLGEIHDQETVETTRLREAGIDVPDDAEQLSERYLYKIGNRKLNGLDFHWVVDFEIESDSYPEDAVVLERTEWGNFYGYLESVKGSAEYADMEPMQALQQAISRASDLRAELKSLEKSDIGAINYGLEQIRLERRGLELDGEQDPEAFQALEQRKAGYEAQYQEVQQKLLDLHEQLARDSAVFHTSSDQQVELKLEHIIRAFQPNAMSNGEKIRHYFSKVWEFVADDPREANTEGGVFPAIFGTVLMVLVMSVMVTPLGVIAAVYLREYAKQGFITRTIRIAVNNLAGVPSIVYGVFGLGFFVYFLGGNIDALFYPEAAPAPVFGTPGLMWASITLALLTLPVVIVTTEEGLARIPSNIREGSLALGATKAETLWRTIIPMASPSIMTGMILAVARAAGEVAPLMMVGVVKLAPSLALDANAPYLHLERKFMHLGFHIYDVGFQSPNVEAARPLVYATALLLVIVIVLLNLFAIQIRNRLRERYKTLEN